MKKLIKLHQKMSRNRRSSTQGAIADMELIYFDMAMTEALVADNSKHLKCRCQAVGKICVSERFPQKSYSKLRFHCSDCRKSFYWYKAAKSFGLDWDTVRIDPSNLPFVIDKDVCQKIIDSESMSWKDSFLSALTQLAPIKTGSSKPERDAVFEINLPSYNRIKNLCEEILDGDIVYNISFLREEICLHLKVQKQNRLKHSSSPFSSKNNPIEMSSSNSSSRNSETSPAENRLSKKKQMSAQYVSDTEDESIQPILQKIKLSRPNPAMAQLSRPNPVMVHGSSQDKFGVIEIEELDPTVDKDSFGSPTKLIKKDSDVSSPTTSEYTLLATLDSEMQKTIQDHDKSIAGLAKYVCDNSDHIKALQDTVSGIRSDLMNGFNEVMHHMELLQNAGSTPNKTLDGSKKDLEKQAALQKIRKGRSKPLLDYDRSLDVGQLVCVYVQGYDFNKDMDLKDHYQCLVTLDFDTSKIKHISSASMDRTEFVIDRSYYRQFVQLFQSMEFVVDMSYKPDDPKSNGNGKDREKFAARLRYNCVNGSDPIVKAFFGKRFEKLMELSDPDSPSGKMESHPEEGQQ